VVSEKRANLKSEKRHWSLFFFFTIYRSNWILMEQQIRLKRCQIFDSATANIYLWDYLEKNVFNICNVSEACLNNFFGVPWRLKIVSVLNRTLPWRLDRRPLRCLQTRALCNIHLTQLYFYDVDIFTNSPSIYLCCFLEFISKVCPRHVLKIHKQSFFLI
jgi:hypothetical protein